mgnify:CR=1 FL=1
MADRLEQLIEMECADALLDSGVSVPLKRWKLPWLKRPVEVRVTMKRPRLRVRFCWRREYLEDGCTNPIGQPRTRPRNWPLWRSMVRL